MITRVAIVEDDADVRQALQLIIESDHRFQVSGAYPDCETAVPRILKSPPDMVLMDIGLPGRSGIEGIREIRKERTDIDIIVLTIHDKDHMVFEALRSGACGYLVKSDQSEDILWALEEVVAGGAPMSTRIARMVVRSLRPDPEADSGLTRREHEVLQELCKGKSYRMIADTLFISEETVKRHLKHIYQKLEVHSKSEAVAKALKGRLIG